MLSLSECNYVNSNNMRTSDFRRYRESFLDFFPHHLELIIPEEKEFDLMFELTKLAGQAHPDLQGYDYGKPGFNWGFFLPKNSFMIRGYQTQIYVFLGFKNPSDAVWVKMKWQS